MRDDFAAPVVNTLSKRVATRCSNPGCRLPTSGPRTEPTKAINIGVAAHITAASPGGPRYDSTMTSEQRCSIENGIWLCQTCSILIDSDVIRYTIDFLQVWKYTAEELAREAIESPRAETTGGGVTAWWWTGCLADGASENPDYFMTVVNKAQKDLPRLNVHVFPSNTFQLELKTEKSDRLLHNQYAIYRFATLRENGMLTESASRFLELDRAELSIRVFRNNYIGDPVLISYELGAQLYDRLLKFISW